METVFADIFGRGPVQGKSIQDYKQLTSLFRSPESGIRKEINPETRFYVLGLAPNAARIAIRYWYAGTVGDIADNIWQHSMIWR
jgi:CRISPR-associated protein Csd1